MDMVVVCHFPGNQPSPLIFVFEETKYTTTQMGTIVDISVSVPQDTQRTAGGEAPSDKKPQPWDSDCFRGEAAEQIDETIPRKTYRQRMILVTNTPSGLTTFLRHLYQPLIVLVTLPAVAYTAVQYEAALSW